MEHIKKKYRQRRGILQREKKFVQKKSLYQRRRQINSLKKTGRGERRTRCGRDLRKITVERKKIRRKGLKSKRGPRNAEKRRERSMTKRDCGGGEGSEEKRTKFVRGRTVHRCIRGVAKGERRKNFVQGLHGSNEGECAVEKDVPLLRGRIRP